MDLDGKRLMVKKQYFKLTNEDGCIFMGLRHERHEVRLSGLNDLDTDLLDSNEVIKGMAVSLFKNKICKRPEINDEFKMTFMLLIISINRCIHIIC